MIWLKRFADPIVLPDGRTLSTLQDAANYIAALPEVERETVDWKLAMAALTMAAERIDHLNLARAAMMKALGMPRDPRPPGLRIVR